jgi:hypothetical protein
MRNLLRRGVGQVSFRSGVGLVGGRDVFICEGLVVSFSVGNQCNSVSASTANLAMTKVSVT